MSHPPSHGAMGGGIGGFLPHVPTSGPNLFDTLMPGFNHAGSSTASGLMGPGGLTPGPTAYGADMAASGLSAGATQGLSALCGPPAGKLG